VLLIREKGNDLPGAQTEKLLSAYGGEKRPFQYIGLRRLAKARRETLTSRCKETGS